MSWPRSVALVCFALLAVRDSAAQGPGPSAEGGQLYQRGVQLVGEGKASEAVEHLFRASDLDAGNVKVHNMLGIALSSAGRSQEAEAAYDRALTLQPDFLPARKNRAVTYFEQGRRQLARREFEDLALLLPDDFVPELFLGLLALEEPDAESAAVHLSKARALEPSNGRVLLALSRAEIYRGNAETALEAARQALAGTVLAAGERLEAGLLLARLGAHREGAGVLAPLWRQNTADYRLGFNLSLTQYRAGALAAALETLNEMIRLGLESGELLNLRGWVCAKMSLSSEARESFEAAIALEPANADHYLDLSTILNNGGEREAAREVLSRGLATSPGKARLALQAGLFHRSWGEREEAERMYRRALELDPTHVPGYLALAVLLSETHRRDEALGVLDKGLGLSPKAALLYYAYGALLLEELENGSRAEQESLREAEEWLRQAAELEPSSAETYYLLGKISVRKGEAAAARAFLEKAVSLNPRLANAFYHLSRLALRRGDKEEAAALATKVRTLRAEDADQERDLFTTMMEHDLRR